MQSLRAAAAAMIVAGALAAGSGPAQGQAPSATMDCGPSSSSQIRTTLYLAQNRTHGGPVSELAWQLFLRDEVTPRFPDGLTVWEAQGQWRNPQGGLDADRTKVLLLIHPDTPKARQSVREIIAVYGKAFDQQSVLWESARVCIAG